MASAEHQIDGWWAQAVTVGWERISGRRLPNQMADGTFTAGRSGTVTTDVGMLRELLLDTDGRHDLFPAMATELRSRPTSKNVRLGMEDGVAEIAIKPLSNSRATVTVAHTRLASPDQVAHWKAFWGDWLRPWTRSDAQSLARAWADHRIRLCVWFDRRETGYGRRRMVSELPLMPRRARRLLAGGLRPAMALTTCSAAD